MTALGRVAALILLAPLVNPRGAALGEDMASFLGQRDLVSGILEYLSPDFHNPVFTPFLAMVLLTAAAMAWARRPIPLHEGLLFLAFLALALYARRNIPLFALVVAPVLAARLEALAMPAGLARFSAIGGWFRWVNRTIALAEGRLAGPVLPALVLAGLALVAVVQWRQGVVPLGMEFDPARQPVAAMAYLEGQLPSGNGFNQLEWGGYLLYRLWPRQRVYIDGQMDFYGDSLVREYFTILELRSGWQEALDRRQVEWALVRTDTPLVGQLARSPGWRVAYQDSLATVVVRR